MDSGSTSSSLLQSVANHDEDGWKRLLGQYQPWVGQLCRRSGVPESDVDDVTQEVFRTVLTSLKSFERLGGRGSFRRWLFTVVRTRVIDYQRRGQNRMPGEGGSAAIERLNQICGESVPSTWFAAMRSESHVDLILDQVRGSFSETTWNAFWLLTFDGWQSAEVAAKLGITKTAARLAKLRVLRRVRQELSLESEASEVQQRGVRGQVSHASAQSGSVKGGSHE